VSWCKGDAPCRPVSMWAIVSCGLRVEIFVEYTPFKLD